VLVATTREENGKGGGGMAFAFLGFVGIKRHGLGGTFKFVSLGLRFGTMRRGFKFSFKLPFLYFHLFSKFLNMRFKRCMVYNKSKLAMWQFLKFEILSFVL
jgi:hypothetical protein